MKQGSASRIDACFQQFQTRYETRDTNELAVFLKNPELFTEGYLYIKELGNTPAQRFVNRYLANAIPGIWRTMAANITKKIYSSYSEVLSDNRPAFKQFLTLLFHCIQRHGNSIHHWTFSQTASFLQACVLQFLSEEQLNTDLFKEEKAKQNAALLPIYQLLRDEFFEKELPFSTLLYLLTKANNIDSYETNATQFATQFHLEVMECIEPTDWLDEFISSQLYFDYRALEYDINTKPRCFLYELDNHGECYIDLILIEHLLRHNHKVILSSKSGPILNDVSESELKHELKKEPFKQLRPYLKSKQLTLISNGCSDVIKPLYDLSNSFKQAYETADIVISKGQGHFHSFPQVVQHFRKKTVLEYKNSHYFLFALKSTLTQQALKKCHGNSIPLQSLYCKEFS